MGSPQSVTTRSSKEAPILAVVAGVAFLAVWYIMSAQASGQGVTVTAKVPGVCGNEIIEIDEQCDGPDLGGATCESRGFSGGTLSCNADCTFNEAACTAPPAGGRGGGAPFFVPLVRIVFPRPGISPDLNGDRRVDIQDLSILLYGFSRTGAEVLSHDLNGDGKLDIADISILFYHWTDRSPL